MKKIIYVFGEKLSTSAKLAQRICKTAGYPTAIDTKDILLPFFVDNLVADIHSHEYDLILFETVLTNGSAKRVIIEFQNDEKGKAIEKFLDHMNMARYKKILADTNLPEEENCNELHRVFYESFEEAAYQLTFPYTKINLGQQSVPFVYGPIPEIEKAAQALEVPYILSEVLDDNTRRITLGGNYSFDLPEKFQAWAKKEFSEKSDETVKSFNENNTAVILE